MEEDNPNPLNVSVGLLQILVNAGIGALNKIKHVPDGTLKMLGFYVPPELSTRHRDCLPGQPKCDMGAGCIYFKAVEDSETASAETLKALGDLQKRFRATRDGLAYYGDTCSMFSIQRVLAVLKAGLQPNEFNFICAAASTNMSFAAYLGWVTFTLGTDAELHRKFNGDVLEAGVKTIDIVDGPDGVDKVFYETSKWPVMLEAMIATYEGIEKPGRSVLGKQPSRVYEMDTGDNGAPSAKKAKLEEGTGNSNTMVIALVVAKAQPKSNAGPSGPYMRNVSPSSALPAAAGRQVLADARLNVTRSSHAESDKRLLSTTSVLARFDGHTFSQGQFRKRQPAHPSPSVTQKTITPTAPSQPRLILGGAGTMPSRLRASSVVSRELEEEEWGNLGLPRGSSASIRKGSSRVQASKRGSSIGTGACDYGLQDETAAASAAEPSSAFHTSRPISSSMRRRPVHADEEDGGF